MGFVERVREKLAGPLTPEALERRAAEGWHPVAVEWERTREGAPGRESSMVEVPFGLRIAADVKHLEEHPGEVEIMLHILEGIVQDRPMSRIAEDLNMSGYRMRTDEPWTQSAVFELLPRLIEFGPRLFSREEWIERRRKLRLQAVS